MIFVTGDIHSHEFARFTQWELGATLTRDDYVIIAGDFGLVWYPTIEQARAFKPDLTDGEIRLLKERLLGEAKNLQWLSEQPWTTLFVDGNHENFPRLTAYPVIEFHGGKAAQIAEHVYHLKRGEVFDLQGFKVFAFGGAASHDMHRRVEGVNWWPQEIPSQKEYDNALKNLERCDWTVDYVITHAPPEGVRVHIEDWISDPARPQNQVTDMLETIRQRLAYKRWFFGHYHREDWLPYDCTCVYRTLTEVGGPAGQRPYLNWAMQRADERGERDTVYWDLHLGADFDALSEQTRLNHMLARVVQNGYRKFRLRILSLLRDGADINAQMQYGQPIIVAMAEAVRDAKSAMSMRALLPLTDLDRVCSKEVRVGDALLESIAMLVRNWKDDDIYPKYRGAAIILESLKYELEQRGFEPRRRGGSYPPIGTQEPEPDIDFEPIFAEIRKNYYE